CPVCELKKNQFYCANCVNRHWLHSHRTEMKKYTGQRDDAVQRARRVDFSATRVLRADVANLQRKVEDVLLSLARLRKDNESKRTKIHTLRATLASHRRTLSAAKLLPNPSTQLVNQLLRERHELQALTSTIARARAALVNELVEVFHVVEVGGRPAVGGKGGTRGEWCIGELVLPVPGDIRRYPPDHTNAVLRHTLHFLSLLTFYLGIKLPFEVTYAPGGGGGAGGQPWIGAGRGGESGGWARWYTKHPLHLSLTPSPTSPTSPSPSPSPSSNNVPPTNLLSDSFVIPPASAASSNSFTTALTMLLYNVSYLAFSQNVDVPLSQAGEVLGNLWGVCCSSELGRKSHESSPYLPPPTPPSFVLDFNQLLQAASTTPARR
ncbi:UV radiation resistance protein/autophagy-related protein 14, partial [Cyathus striatus]